MSDASYSTEDVPPLAFAAIRLYHRAEQYGFALFNEALNGDPVETWPYHKTDRKPPHFTQERIWRWAYKRWGKNWSRWEYDNRELF